MSADFLGAMAKASRRRVAAAKCAASFSDLKRRCADRADPLPLKLSGAFDVIAEIKARSPAAGPLADADPARRAALYAAGGAAAISVLTEAEAFGGALDDLEIASETAASYGTPTMRKDFLVDPYQVLEARAYGASGILLIVRMLDDAAMSDMIATADALSMFVLMEVFDEDDIDRAGGACKTQTGHKLIGVNSRNLATLKVDKARLLALAHALPRAALKVAESGIETGEDAASIARAGYHAALVGSALMRAADPKAHLCAMLQAGRAGTAPCS